MITDADVKKTNEIITKDDLKILITKDDLTGVKKEILHELRCIRDDMRILIGNKRRNRRP